MKLVRFLPTLLVVMAVLAGAGQASAQWETVRFNNSTWVTFRSFCDFYGFRSQRTIGEKGIEISGNLGTLRFTKESNEAFFNGGKVWMSFKLTEAPGGQLLLNQVDVAKLWEPLLRPGRVRGLRPPRGVVIDPGHGGSDRGARGLRGLVEKDVTLDTARRLDAILKRNRVPTVLTRNSDVFISLERRAAIAGQYRDYIFVSIHYNWGPRHAAGVETFSLTPQYAPSTSGPQTVRVSDTQRESGNRFDDANLLLCHLIHEEKRKLHPAKNDRGIKRARFAVLRLAQVPAVLVEGGFVSNPGDAALITDPGYRQRLAEAVARGIMNYFALARGRPSGPAPRDSREEEDWTAERPSPPGRAERTVVERTPPPPPAPEPEPAPPPPTRPPTQRTPTPPRQAPAAATTSASRPASSATVVEQSAKVEEPVEEQAKTESGPSRQVAAAAATPRAPAPAPASVPAGASGGARAGVEEKRPSAAKPEGQAPPLPPPPQPTAVVTSYRIQPGDNLGKIARRYGVTVEQLKQWNGLSGDTIQAGKTLRVRPPDAVAQAAPPSPSEPSRSGSGSTPAVESEAPKPPEVEVKAEPAVGPAIETEAPPVERPLSEPVRSANE